MTTADRATVEIDLRAKLNNEDDEGYDWALLSGATGPSAVTEGAVVVAGTLRFWSWVRIRRVDPDGEVHFEQISDDAVGSVASTR